MVAYNFQPQFFSPILSGVKVSTIRPNGNRQHAQVGQEVQLFIGMRTPQCRRLLHAPCVASRDIEIHEKHLLIDGQVQANPAFFEILATSEGFNSFGNMQAWFQKRYGLPCANFTQIKWDFALAEFPPEDALAEVSQG